MNDEEIEPLLAATVSSYRQIPNWIKVGTAIEAVTGKRVIALSSDAADGQLLGDIGKTAETLIADSQGTPIGTTRLNELGNAIEEPLFAACSKVGLPATWPRRANGSGGRSGYPNIAIDIDGMRPTYLEAKVVGAGSENSSFRSFYLSPSDNRRSEWTPGTCYSPSNIAGGRTVRTGWSDTA